jgi:hypothetical protein
MEIRHLRCSKIDGGLIKYETIYSRFDKFQFGPQDSTSDGTFNSFFFIYFVGGNLVENDTKGLERNVLTPH